MNSLPVIDFHTHCLPGMDDGSKSVENSIQMLHLMHKNGTGVALLTPHYYRKRESIASFLNRRETAIAKLSSCLDENCPKIIPCAETAFYFGIESDPDLNSLCIPGTNVLLLEMPVNAWTIYEVNAIEDLCFNRKLTVVLAHFERFLVNKRYSALSERILRLPVLVQLNAESLLPIFSKRPWLRMLRDGNAHLLGSDCHNLTNRPPNLDKGRAVIEKHLGAEILTAIDKRAAGLLCLPAVTADKNTVF